MSYQYFKILSPAVIQKPYTVMKGYWYLLKALPPIITKHLIIDPFQDVSIKFLLEKMIASVLSNFSDKKADFSDGIAHTMMHSVFQPLLHIIIDPLSKKLGLASHSCRSLICSSKSLSKIIAPPINFCGNIQPKINSGSSITIVDQSSQTFGLSNKILIDRVLSDSEHLTDSRFYTATYETNVQVSTKNPIASYPPVPEDNPLPPQTVIHKTRDQEMLDRKKKLEQKFGNTAPKQSIYNKIISNIPHFLEEWLMHASIKAVAITIFPVIYETRGQYTYTCGDTCETIIKFVGINPLELFGYLPKSISKILPSIPGSISQILPEPHYLFTASYYDYQHLRSDSEMYDFLRSFDLYMEMIDASIHFVDHIDLVYKNQDLTTRTIAFGTIAITLSTLYYSTNLYEAELDNASLSLNSTNESQNNTYIPSSYDTEQCDALSFVGEELV